MQLALTAVASILSGVGIDKLYNSWLNRKKPASEIHVTEATASEIHVRAGSTAGDAVIRMLSRLDHAQETIDRLRAERDSWQDEYDKVFVQRDQLILERDKLRRETKLYDDQIRQMRATLTLSKKNYDNTQDMEIGSLPDKDNDPA